MASIIRYSPSTIKKCKSCPFLIYCKETNQEKDKDTDNSYGTAGTVMHDSLEYYYSKLQSLPLTFALEETKNLFNNQWELANILNPKIDKNLYWLGIINGIKLKIEPTHFEYEFKFTSPVNFIGYADIMNTTKHWIGDWKSSTYKASKVKEYKEQLKYYAYAYYKEFGHIPDTWVYFNKVNKPFEFKWTEKDMQEINQELIDLEIEYQRRFKELDFPRRPSRTNCYFCNYKRVCSGDLLRKKSIDKYKIIFHLKKHQVMVEGTIPDIIHRKIEKEINYTVKNAHFIIQAMKAKGVHYDGIKRLYRRRAFGGITGMGYVNTIYKILKEYAQSIGQVLQLEIKEYRDKDIMTFEQSMPNKLNTPYEFGIDNYSFQKDAIQALLRNRWGIAEIGTGGGKTAIAAECIRQLATRTLFVIDNKDLLLQTKTEYEKMLGLECGIVGMGLKEWDKPIIVATIQTLVKYLKEFKRQLAAFNLVIFDECHSTGADSFTKLSKYLINTKYRLNFSATARRDDGDTNIIYNTCGTIVYKKNAKELIDLKVLMNPEIIFYESEDKTQKKIITDIWQDAYTDGIVENENRNKRILDIVKQYPDKQIMILCTRTKHCQYFTEQIAEAKLIYGKTDNKIRFETLNDFKEGRLRILVGNLRIFNKGLNIKNLNVLINATGNAGETITVQTIGRTLRKNPGKKEAIYIDFIDEGDYLHKHSMSRIDALKKQDYEVKIKQWEEKVI